MTASAERRTARRPAKDARRRAREAALQMLYQWEVGRVSMHEVVRTFWTDGPCDTDAENGDDGRDDNGDRHAGGTAALATSLRAFATRLAVGVADNIANVDPMIAEAAEHWRIERMNVLDRLILRLAVYEFIFEPETPRRVVINEALELARTFSTDDAVRFINGILDAIRKVIEAKS